MIIHKLHITRPKLHPKIYRIFIGNLMSLKPRFTPLLTLVLLLNVSDQYIHDIKTGEMIFAGLSLNFVKGLVTEFHHLSLAIGSRNFDKIIISSAHFIVNWH